MLTKTLRFLALPLIVISSLTACAGDGADPGDDDATPADPAVLSSHTDFKTVFTTKKRVLGETLGGLTGADAICSDSAAIAGLSGTFKAWLSDKATSASSRLSHAPVPYRLVGGAQVAADWDDLIDGTLDHALDRDERGAAINDRDATYAGVAWTATSVLGDLIPWNPSNPNTTENPQLDCGGWRDARSGVGLLGLLTSVEVTWTQTNSGIGCDQTAHLYCFEQ